MKIRKPIVIAACSTVGFIGILFGLLFLSGYPEGYCYFYPSIDTIYAEGYSEEAFSKLEVGMTMSEVDKIMCKPLSVGKNQNSVTRVFYTRDGKAPIGDFAWFGRSLYVSNGVLTKIGSTIYYD